MNLQMSQQQQQQQQQCKHEDGRQWACGVLFMTRRVSSCCWMAVAVLHLLLADATAVVPSVSASFIPIGASSPRGGQSRATAFRDRTETTSRTTTIDPTKWYHRSIIRASTNTKHLRKRSSLLIRWVDPASLLTSIPIDVGALAMAAACGVFSQQPKIQQLEREVEITRMALTQSEQDMVSKIAELEERLFEMDREFEGQTAQFKKVYDSRMKSELERVKNQLKDEYKLKLEVSVDRLRSEMLQTQFEEINGLNDRQEQLLQLRVQKQRLDDTNRKLEQALADSTDELSRMQAGAIVAANKRQKRLFFF